jgi:hypothetical protein
MAATCYLSIALTARNFGRTHNTASRARRRLRRQGRARPARTNAKRDRVRSNPPRLSPHAPRAPHRAPAHAGLGAGLRSQRNARPRRNQVTLMASRWRTAFHPIEPLPYGAHSDTAPGAPCLGAPVLPVLAAIAPPAPRWRGRHLPRSRDSERCSPRSYGRASGLHTTHLLSH